MTGKGIQGVIYPWKRVAVLLGDVVKFSIVHAKSCGAIFLTNQDDWRCHGLEDGSMMSLSCISRSSVPTSSCLANGKRLGCCLIGGWSAVSILCCVTVVWPISLLFLENTSSNSWNSLSAELFCSGDNSAFSRRSGSQLLRRVG
ncbi:hypothetical protein TNCV_2779121 [Trichonephila clavipes]|nr:hypothetical protein TNCV_2779121 [Trichonephila clavipes]